MLATKKKTRRLGKERNAIAAAVDSWLVGTPGKDAGFYVSVDSDSLVHAGPFASKAHAEAFWDLLNPTATERARVNEWSANDLECARYDSDNQFRLPGDHIPWKAWEAASQFGCDMTTVNNLLEMRTK